MSESCGEDNEIFVQEGTQIELRENMHQHYRLTDQVHLEYWELKSHSQMQIL